MTADALRAPDADRDRAAAALREHFAAGRLSEEELSQRLETVYAATTLGELRRLREDLPDLPLSPRERRAELAVRQAELRRRLLQQAGGSFAPFVICSAIWAAAGAHGAFWPAFVLIPAVLFVVRNMWRLHGPAPELDRVQAELEHGGHGRHRGRHRHRRGIGAPPHGRGLR